MSFLAALRTRLNGPVAACVQAAKDAAERAMSRLSPEDAAPAADPSRAGDLPVPPGPDPFDEPRLHLARLSVALASCGDAVVVAAGARFHAAVRALLDALARQPAALPDHDRPLTSWVPALAAATERFVSMQREAPSSDRRNQLVAVLDQVARRVQAHAQTVDGALQQG
jgi:hypothetical protein